MNTRSLLILLLSLLAIDPTFAGSRPIPETEVPAPVLSRFKSAYPGATKVQFELEHENRMKKEYEVVFELNGKRHKTEFEFDGIGVVEDKED
jgi:hypothetical protein